MSTANTNTASNNIPLNIAQTNETTTTNVNTTIIVAGYSSGTTCYSLFSDSIQQVATMESTTRAPIKNSTLSSVPIAITAGLKPYKFDGKVFKMWQKKMMFVHNIKKDEVGPIH